jgi:possible murein hydrolase exporter
MVLSTFLIMLFTGKLADIIIGIQEKILGNKDKEEGKNE